MLVARETYMFLPAPGVKVIVPAGTPVLPATYYPQPNHFWATPGEDAPADVRMYAEDPGFLYREQDVVEVEDVPAPVHVRRRRNHKPG